MGLKFHSYRKAQLIAQYLYESVEETNYDPVCFAMYLIFYAVIMVSQRII